MKFTSQLLPKSFINFFLLLLLVIGIVGGHQFFAWRSNYLSDRVFDGSNSLQNSPQPSGYEYVTPPYTDREVIDIVNKERLNLGLAALTIDDKLTYAAQMKAGDICEKQYWAHVSPDGVTPWQWIESEGFDYDKAGENLARDFTDANTLVASWMASPLHKENIVNPIFTTTGVGSKKCVLEGLETRVTVQLYSKPANTEKPDAKIEEPPDSTKPIHCPISEKCGGGSTLLTPAQCKDSTCCGLKNDVWKFYSNKQKCFEDQSQGL